MTTKEANKTAFPQDLVTEALKRLSTSTEYAVIDRDLEYFTLGVSRLLQLRERIEVPYDDGRWPTSCAHWLAEAHAREENYNNSDPLTRPYRELEWLGQVTDAVLSLLQARTSKTT